MKLAIHKVYGIRANQMRWIKALPNNETNNLSPLVVSNPKIPLRGLPPGTNFSQITIPINKVAINIKNSAVGQVQAIQEKVKPIKPYPKRSLWQYSFLQNKSLSLLEL